MLSGMRSHFEIRSAGGCVYNGKRGDRRKNPGVHIRNSGLNVLQ